MMFILKNLFSPISIAFIVIIAGYFIGKIKVFKVSLDLSAVLIVAVFMGWLLKIIVSRWTIVDIEEFEANMKFFSNFGTALFVSSVGVSTGTILDFRKWKELKAILIGSLMVISSFVTMKIISLFDDNISISKLLGSLCGALTTTPGLSAACELEDVVSEEIILGYGCTYLFGVIATVLFVQIATTKVTVISEENNKLINKIASEDALCGLIQIGSVIVFGRLIGGIEIVNFSLGNSGGMLCSGIVIGMIMKKIFTPKATTTNNFKNLKNIGLSLFLAGNGIQSGIQISSGFDIKMIFYGVIMTIVPIASGALIYRLLFREGTATTTIAGGMTSTPAIGILSEKISNICLSKYVLAYFGALITIVVSIRLCK